MPLPVIKRIAVVEERYERYGLLREVAALHTAGLSLDEAYELNGIEARKNERLPTGLEFIPTPAMLETSLQAIRDTWSAQETERRRVVGNGTVEAPQYVVRDLVA